MVVRPLLFCYVPPSCAAPIPLAPLAQPPALVTASCEGDFIFDKPVDIDSAGV